MEGTGGGGADWRAAATGGTDARTGGGVPDALGDTDPWQAAADRGETGKAGGAKAEDDGSAWEHWQPGTQGSGGTSGGRPTSGGLGPLKGDEGEPSEELSGPCDSAGRSGGLGGDGHKDGSGGASTLYSGGIKYREITDTSHLWVSGYAGVVESVNGVTLFCGDGDRSVDPWEDRVKKDTEGYLGLLQTLEGHHLTGIVTRMRPLSDGGWWTLLGCPNQRLDVYMKHEDWIWMVAGSCM